MNDKICFYSPPLPKIKSYYEMIDLAVEYGLSGVEGFSCFEFENPDIKAAYAISEYADKKGIKIPCFSVYANPVCDNDGFQLKRLFEYVQVAKILGSPYLHHTVISEFRNPDNVLPYKEAFFTKGIEIVKKVYDYAESIGIKAIYEEQGFILNGIEAFGEFLNKVDRDIGIVADFGNIYQSGDEIESFIKAFSEKIVHVHIKDVAVKDISDGSEALKTLDGKYLYETEIGKGTVDIQRIINLLKTLNYKGFYSLEYDGLKSTPKSVRELLKFIDYCVS